MQIKAIKTKRDYEAALARIDTLMDAKPGSKGADELDILSTLVSVYEDTNFPIDLPDPVEGIKFRMEQQGLRPKDLVPYFGSASKVSEVLNRQRPLSLMMIRKLTAGLGIPADVLLQPMRLTKPTTAQKSKTTRTKRKLLTT